MRAHLRRVGAISAMLWLSGCVSGPDYRVPATAMAVAPDAQGRFASSGPPTYTQAEPPDHWWQMYQDAQLEAYVAEALRANTDLRAADANLRRASAVVLEHQAQGTLRTWLAQLGLDAQKIVVPSGMLSGGERLKAALACVLYADPPAQLLLLDEPGNHLDLPSLQALETMLRSYRGALVVVSHDDAFLDNLALTDRLSASAEGWRLEPW